MRNYYQQGLVTVGATGDFSFTQYRNLAVQLAKKDPNPFLFVGLGKNGDGPVVNGFSAQTPASDMFARFAETPGSFAYIALFGGNDSPEFHDKDQPRDEALFVAVAEGPTQVVNKVAPSHIITKSNNDNLIAGLAIAAGGLGLVVLGAQKKKG